MVSDIFEILDHENIGKIHGIGHDWGSYLLSWLDNYHSSRLYSYCFVGVGYMPPGLVYELERVNAALMLEVGYDTFGFWELFYSERRNSCPQETGICDLRRHNLL
jgi:pimeloyl-ACP methyl ester carboxylesterase